MLPFPVTPSLEMVQLKTALGFPGEHDVREGLRQHSCTSFCNEDTKPVGVGRSRALQRVWALPLSLLYARRERGVPWPVYGAPTCTPAEAPPWARELLRVPPATTPALLFTY